MFLFIYLHSQAFQKTILVWFDKIFTCSIGIDHNNFFVCNAAYINVSLYAVNGDAFRNDIFFSFCENYLLVVLRGKRYKNDTAPGNKQAFFNSNEFHTNENMTCISPPCYRS